MIAASRWDPEEAEIRTIFNYDANSGIRDTHTSCGRKLGGDIHGMTAFNLLLGLMARVHESAMPTYPCTHTLDHLHTCTSSHPHTHTFTTHDHILPLPLHSFTPSPSHTHPHTGTITLDTPLQFDHIVHRFLDPSDISSAPHSSRWWRDGGSLAPEVGLLTHNIVIQGEEYVHSPIPRPSVYYIRLVWDWD